MQRVEIIEGIFEKTIVPYVNQANSGAVKEDGLRISADVAIEVAVIFPRPDECLPTIPHRQGAVYGLSRETECVVVCPPDVSSIMFVGFGYPFKGSVGFLGGRHVPTDDPA